MCISKNKKREATKNNATRPCLINCQNEPKRYKEKLSRKGLKKNNNILTCSPTPFRTNFHIRGTIKSI